MVMVFGQMNEPQSATFRVGHAALTINEWRYDHWHSADKPTLHVSDCHDNAGVAHRYGECLHIQCSGRRVNRSRLASAASTAHKQQRVTTGSAKQAVTNLFIQLDKDADALATSSIALFSNPQDTNSSETNAVVFYPY